MLNAAVTPCVNAVKRIPELTSQTPQELFDRARDFLENEQSPDSALLYLTALTSLAETNPSTDTSSSIYPIAYNTMGGIYASIYGNYSEAAVSLLKALDLAEQNHLHDLKKRITFNLKAMEYEQGQLMGNDSISTITIHDFTNILKSLNADTDQDLITPLLISIADIGIREDILGEAVNGYESIPGKENLDISLKDMSQVIRHMETKQYDAALQTIQEAIDSLEETNSVMKSGCNMEFNLIKAHILLKSGKEEGALKEYEKMAEKYEKEGYLFSVFEIYKHLREYYEKKGNQILARDYELKELKAKDCLINRSRSLSLEGSRALYNEEKLKREIVIEAARSHTYKIIFWISLSFLIIVIGLLILLYRKFQQLNESHNIIVRNDISYFRPERNIPLQESDTTKDADENSLIFDKVESALKATEEVYDEEFSTGRLAKLIGEKPSSVSASILAMTGETTTQYIARARIREACRRINDRVNYGDYTIEAIGQSVGYRSRSHFGSVFKKIVGMPPSEYASKIHR